MRLVYEVDEKIKTIKTAYRLVDDKKVSPSDADLRRLDGQADVVRVGRQ